MPKFFIKTDNIKENEEIHIIGNDVNHLKNVLRKKVDDKITVCNSDTSINYECIIIEIEENEIICKIVNEEESVSESKLNITIVLLVFTGTIFFTPSSVAFCIINSILSALGQL